MSKKTIKYLTDVLNYITYHNRMAPFPVFDTEYVELIKNKLEIMKENNVNYDKLPTACCKYCLNLHSLVDEEENVICTRCGSINEELIFEDYEAYEQYLKDNEDN